MWEIEREGVILYCKWTRDRVGKSKERERGSKRTEGKVLLGIKDGGRS